MGRTADEREREPERETHVESKRHGKYCCKIKVAYLRFVRCIYNLLKLRWRRAFGAFWNAQHIYTIESAHRALCTVCMGFCELEKRTRRRKKNSILFAKLWMFVTTCALTEYYSCNSRFYLSQQQQFNSTKTLLNAVLFLLFFTLFGQISMCGFATNSRRRTIAVWHQRNEREKEKKTYKVHTLRKFVDCFRMFTRKIIAYSAARVPRAPYICIYIVQPCDDVIDAEQFFFSCWKKFNCKQVAASTENKRGKQNVNSTNKEKNRFFFHRSWFSAKRELVAVRILE